MKKFLRRLWTPTYRSRITPEDYARQAERARYMMLGRKIVSVYRANEIDGTVVLILDNGEYVGASVAPWIGPR